MSVLQEEYDENKKEYDDILHTQPEKMWSRDLDDFEKEYKKM
jgi:hypothetical protein